VKTKVEQATAAATDAANDAAAQVSQAAENAKDQASQAAEKAKDQVSQAVEKAKDDGRITQADVEKILSKIEPQVKKVCKTRFALPFARSHLWLALRAAVGRGQRVCQQGFRELQEGSRFHQE
jgi:pyruvate/2-oxoglutarate dehydrogenase complex dihydrolipoamide acyltransferase (E2) component